MVFRHGKKCIAILTILALMLLYCSPVLAQASDRWAAKADMLTAREHMGVVAVDGKIYAIGGRNSAYLKAVEVYDPLANTWTQKADMPTARTVVMTAVLDGKIYVIGGSTGNVSVKTVEVYDPASNTWTPKADMPTARHAAKAVVISGKIYVFGGYSFNTNSPLKVVEVYDPATNTWTSKSDMPVAKYSFGADVINGKVYTIGGSTSGMPLATVEEYDPATDTWVAKAPLPTARYCMGVSVLNDKIYAIGGAKSSTISLKIVEEYDPAANTWTRKTDMPTARGHLETAALGDKIYAVGGLVSNSYLKTLEEYTPVPVSNIIVPKLTTDLSKYVPGDIVTLNLKLTETLAGDKTNSVTFEIEYDSTTFELVNNDVKIDVVNGYIPFQTVMDIGEGNVKRVHLTYLEKTTDIPLQENAIVATVYFKVKESPTPGIKAFSLRPVTMLDSTYKVYNVNENNPVIKTVEVLNSAVIEGYVNIYLSDEASAQSGISQNSINETFRKLKFTMKNAATGTITLITGADIFVPDEKGNLATIDANNKMTGRFRIYTDKTDYTALVIGGMGYLEKGFSVTPAIGSVCTVSTPAIPVELYPGDVGGVADWQLTNVPDGKVTNADGSAWFKLYDAYIANTATADEKIMMDFTKDGVVDGADFALWLKVFRMLTAVSP